jgi:3-hydroxyacyl-[acyl-carrier-protein] dehydratase
MKNTWHQLKNLEKSDSTEFSAETTVTHDSLWFEGHFPGSPILPGIAQLALVSDMLRDHAARSGGDINIVAIKRVRFRQFIKPGDPLQLTAEADAHDPSAYKFRVMVNGQVACNGVMVTAPRRT